MPKASTSYLQTTPAKVDIHGVLLQVAGCGVLIQGPAASGKSQLALELLDRGHSFVADDLIEVHSENAKLLGRGIGICSDFLSLRCGLIIDVMHRYGATQKRAESSIDLVVSEGLARNLEPEIWTQCGVSRMRYALKTLPGSAIVVEALAREWQDQRAGHDARALLYQRHQQLLRQSA